MNKKNKGDEKKKKKENGQGKCGACTLPAESPVGWILGSSPRMTVQQLLLQPLRLNWGMVA